ncbi:hypothetical protein Dip510_001188 [Elusimicrobium posterum]|uniref:hypothetical protein n=1 Tax=Elusimicrobium posterum TaxID=3116653 RepID=UPI003C78A897
MDFIVFIIIIIVIGTFITIVNGGSKNKPATAVDYLKQHDTAQSAVHEIVPLRRRKNIFLK